MNNEEITVQVYEIKSNILSPNYRYIARSDKHFRRIYGKSAEDAFNNFKRHYGSKTPLKMKIVDKLY